MTRNRTVGLAFGFVLLLSAGAASGAPQSGEGRRGPGGVDALRVVVPAKANIFGAGRATPPHPGGGGGGVLPPFVRIGGSRVVTFPRVTGRVNPIRDYDEWFGPEGEIDVRTDVRSYRGISGIMHRNGIFLVGVFLTSAPPARPAPPTLDFTSRSDQFTLAPRIGQTFLIGHGKGRRYRIPRGAARLFLGFADAFLYIGAPGWYDNNAGRLVATVRLAAD